MYLKSPLYTEILGGKTMIADGYWIRSCWSLLLFSPETGRQQAFYPFEEKTTQLEEPSLETSHSLFENSLMIFYFFDALVDVQSAALDEPEFAVIISCLLKGDFTSIVWKHVSQSKSPSQEVIQTFASVSNFLEFYGSWCFYNTIIISK